MLPCTVAGRLAGTDDVAVHFTPLAKTPLPLVVLKAVGVEPPEFDATVTVLEPEK
jgi:hypothetical protein